MKRIYYIPILLLLFGICKQNNAQTSDAKLESISLSTDFLYMKEVMDTLPHDTVKIRLVFGCSLLSVLTKMHIKIGTTKDNGDIFEEEFPVSKTGSDYGFTSKTCYYLNDGTNSGTDFFNTFNMGYAGFILLSNKAKYGTIKWISVYGIDKFKRKTNTRYYHIN